MQIAHGTSSNPTLTAFRSGAFATAPQLGNFEPESEDNNEVADKFQEFVAGTFYQQMLKSLRSTVGEPAYLHGGSAEELFQSQLDLTVAEQLSAEHGASLSRSLYDAYAARAAGAEQAQHPAPETTEPEKSAGVTQPPEPLRASALSQHSPTADASTEVIGLLNRK